MFQFSLIFLSIQFIGFPLGSNGFVVTPPPVECPNYLCDGKGDGSYAYEYFGIVNPHYFLKCFAGKASCQFCWPGNLVFREDCNQCLHSFDEQCPTTTTTPIPTTTTTDDKTPTATSTTTKTKCPNLCPDVGSNFSGNIQDPANPRHYVACWEGRTVACIRCPANLIFNELMNSCVYPGSMNAPYQ